MLITTAGYSSMPAGCRSTSHDSYADRSGAAVTLVRIGRPVPIASALMEGICFETVEVHP